MADINEKLEEQQEKRPERSPGGWMVWILVGILIVLVMANLDALLKPLKTLGRILTPIMIGLVMAYLLNPFLRFFQIKVFYKLRRTVNRALSMLCTYIVMFAILAGVIWLILPQVIDSINDFRVNGMFYVNRLIDSLNNVIASLPFELPGGNENILSLEKLLTYSMQLIEQLGTGLIGSIGNFASSALTALKNVLVGFFVSIYVLLSKDRLSAGCRRILHALFSDRTEKALLRYTSQANSKFGGFIVGKMVDSLMVGFTCALFFTVFKIPYPILIAVIIGVTDFIPFFGPFIGAIPSAIIIFIADPSKALLFVILILVVQQIDGNLLAPLILGDHTGLTSLGVLIAITLMGGLFGFIGMLIGVPLFALIMTMLDDLIKHRLRKKSSPTDLYSYYSADAFIRPSDEMETVHITMTQKFVRWVAAVDEEIAAKDYKPSFWRYLINHFRLGCLHIGRFFKRIFSVKLTAEDRRVSLVNLVRTRGLIATRSYPRVLVLSLLTLGIYPLYLVEIFAESINIACSRDGKRTWGVFPYFTLGIVTLGIFPIIWHCQILRRFKELCARNGEKCCLKQSYFLLWSLLGAPILVGPFLARARFLRAYNQVCRIFNETHTFPLPMEALEEEAAEGIAYRASIEAAKAAQRTPIIPAIMADPTYGEAPHEDASATVVKDALDAEANSSNAPVEE